MRPFRLLRAGRAGNTPPPRLGLHRPESAAHLLPRPRQEIALAASAADYPLYFSQQFRRMSLSTVIVDDEQLARDELAFLLKSVDDVHVVATGKNGLEALKLSG